MLDNPDLLAVIIAATLILGYSALSVLTLL